MAYFAHREPSFVEKPAGLALIITVAAAVGAVTAMLTTPKRGSEMRQRISARLKRAKDEASQQKERLKDSAADVASNTTETVKKTTDKAKDMADKAKETVNDVAESAKQKSDEAESRTHNRINR